tara:strand:+ start:5686 stop:5919 length:234 start_codon:yes stop_codon:yes gene_type:complete
MGRYDSISIDRDAPELRFWVAVYGRQASDKELIKLIGPDSRIMAEHSNVAAKTQAQSFITVGKRRREAWPPGTYRGV